MEKRLIEEDSLHGVKVEVTDVHLQDLQTFEQVKEGDHLTWQNLEGNQLDMTNCFRQWFPSVK